jgi:2-phosphosulfolactate phosphatase
VIDVSLLPGESPPVELAVVIDVLRATSTATQALAGGYQRVVCADSLERALSLRAPGLVLAGERCCVKPPGFDQGNSPLEALNARGSELVLATTNGAPAIVAASRRASAVMLACLLNLDAVTEAVCVEYDPPRSELCIVCAGTDGSPALEDVYVAGRLSAALPGPRTDAARVAEAVARGYRTPAEALRASADARSLRAAGATSDIAFCARESKIELVPRVLRAGIGFAVVGAAEPRPGCRAEAAIHRLDTVEV